jgi:hypothetical protein
LDQIDDQHHHGNDQKDMNESSKRVRANQPKKPKHEQNNEYSPEHREFLSVKVLFYFAPYGASALISPKYSWRDF